MCTGVCAQVCPLRCVCSGMCMQMYDHRCVLTGVCAHRGVCSGVCAQVREERAQGLCLDQRAVADWRSWSGLSQGHSPGWVQSSPSLESSGEHRSGRARAESSGRPRSQQDSAGSTGSGPTWWTWDTGGAHRQGCTPGAPPFSARPFVYSLDAVTQTPPSPRSVQPPGSGPGFSGPASCFPPAPTGLQQTQRPQLAPTDHPLAEMSPHLDPFYITTGPDLLHSLHGLLPTPVRDPQPCNTHPHSRLRQMVGLSMVTPGHHRSGRVATGSCKAEDAKLAPDLLL